MAESSFQLRRSAYPKMISSRRVAEKVVRHHNPKPIFLARMRNRFFTECQLISSGSSSRRVTPERREELPDEINWHSVKNRFLMRAKNIGFGLWWRTTFSATLLDEIIFGYALLRNWKLLSAMYYWWRMHPRGWLQKRKIIQRKRRVS